MKLKQLMSVCTKRKAIYIYNAVGRECQYIGDGSAVYPAYRMPEVDRETVLGVFDINEKQKNSWMIQVQELPENINIEDCTKDDQMVKKLDIEINGHVLFKTTQGLVAMDAKYLKPIEDAESTEFYERPLADGTACIVAKDGFELTALILPIKCTKRFYEQLDEVMQLCRVRLENEADEEQEDG